MNDNSQIVLNIVWKVVWSAGARSVSKSNSRPPWWFITRGERTGIYPGPERPWNILLCRRSPKFAPEGAIVELLSTCPRKSPWAKACQFAAADACCALPFLRRVIPRQVSEVESPCSSILISICRQTSRPLKLSEDRRLGLRPRLRVRFRAEPYLSTATF